MNSARLSLEPQSAALPPLIKHDGVSAVLADLDRLHALIGDAGETLLERFAQAQVCADALAARNDAAASMLRSTLQGAITALQFQDIAQQLIAHAARQLEGLSFDASAGAALPMSGPVSQAAMSAGSIDLF